jgi:predicted alpha/beta-hydrolase family hydrolase
MVKRVEHAQRDAPPTRDVTLTLAAKQRVSALLLVPADARALLLLAHGAGAGMRHPFMEAVAGGLAGLRMATLRYQFPYMERGSSRPDAPALCHATVRAAAAAARKEAPTLPLLAGGKSFGGRMTSQAQAGEPLAGVRGLIFLGFPLHPAGRPGDERARHLSSVEVPMLFLQGTRDSLADSGLMAQVTARLGARATLKVIDDADHSFHVRARSGRDDAGAMGELLAAIDAWVSALLAPA